MLIEACIDDLTSAHNAVAGGAHRIELCQDLADGGTTPSHGMLGHLIEHCPLPVFPLIRLRGGSFVYSSEEVEVMCRDIASAKKLGAPGMVIGALTKDGNVDVEATRAMRDAAGDAAITFHRAFDVCHDPFHALDDLIELGLERVLTSGQHSRASQGMDLIKRLVEHAGRRITIMAGGGVSEQDVETLVRETGVTEIHIRATMVVRDKPDWTERPPVAFRRAIPGDETARLVTDPQRVTAIREAATRGESA